MVRIFYFVNFIFYICIYRERFGKLFKYKFCTIKRYYYGRRKVMENTLLFVLACWVSLHNKSPYFAISLFIKFYLILMIYFFFSCILVIS